MSTADVTELLRASRPTAPETLRERVGALAATADAPTASRRRLPALPRLRIVVSLVAATAVAAAALVAVVRPGHNPGPVRRAAGPQLLPYSGTIAHGGAASAKAPAGKSATDAHSSTAAVPAPIPSGVRAQDYEAQIALEVEDGDALSNATKRAVTIVENLGGHMLGVQFSSGDTGSASLLLRVPTARVEEAVAQLTTLGRITAQQVQIQDLQEQLDRLDRQVATLRRRIAHIAALLGDPDLTAERRAQLETTRAELQATLGRAHRQLGGVAQQAALATIQLTLTTKQQSAVPVPGSRFHRSLHELARVLTWEGIALLYALVVVAPFAILGALAWLGARARRRGAERRLLARS